MDRLCCYENAILPHPVDLLEMKTKKNKLMTASRHTAPVYVQHSEQTTESNMRNGNPYYTLQEWIAINHLCWNLLTTIFCLKCYWHGDET